jgi:hypothetical protein
LIKDFFINKKRQCVNLTDKIIKETKHKSDYITAHTRHFLKKVSLKDIKFPREVNISQKAIREVTKKAAAGILDVGKLNKHVVPMYHRGKALYEGSQAAKFMTKVFDKPWKRKSLFIAAGIGALAMVEKTVSGFSAAPVIPKHYDKGYDILKENMTDFGSPVHLLKTAMKTITPYYSTVRKSITSSVNTITNKNLALFLSKHAIGHTRY